MMKKLLLTVMLMGLFVLLAEPARELLGNLVRLTQPTTHTIQTGEWLSKLAVKYYGDSSYWKELALVNRAPRADLIFPGEEVIVPSFQTIQEVRKARSLSLINQLVRSDTEILVEPTKEQSKSGTTSEKNTARSAAPKERSTGPKAEVTPKVKDDRTNGHSPTDSEAANKLALQLKEQTASNNQAKPSFWRSTPVLTALVILGIVAFIGTVLYFQNKRRDEEISAFGAKHGKAAKRDSEKAGEMDSKERGTGFIFGGNREKEPENKSTGKNRKDLEIV